MDAVLLAGGFGTRLRPLTYTRPKPLLPVAGRPMLEWVLDALPQEVDRVVLAVNWLADELERWARTTDAAVELVVVRENEPLGTAGAVQNCARHLKSDRFLVLNADIVSDMDLDAMVKSHDRHSGMGIISLKEVAPADVVHFGVIEPDGAAASDGAVRIRRFVEKPAHPKDAPSRLINAGAYLLRNDVLDLVPKGRLVSMEKEIFPLLIPKGFWGLPFQGAWIDVGDPVRLVQASRHLDAGFAAGPHSHISEAATFEDSVAGTRCTVEPGATVRRCVLGDRVTVRSGTVLEDCIVGDDETVHGSSKGGRIWTKPPPKGYPEKQVGNALKAT